MMSFNAALWRTLLTFDSHACRSPMFSRLHAKLS